MHRRSLALFAAAALLATAGPVGAHQGRPTEFPPEPGEVPKYRRSITCAVRVPGS